MRVRRNATSMALALALVVMGSGWLIGGGTRALFTDTGTSTGNAFTTGTVDLRLTDSDETEQAHGRIVCRPVLDYTDSREKGD